MVIYIDIDETICHSPNKPDYTTSTPIKENIEKANKLYDAGNLIVYWTARGSATGVDWTELTKAQLKEIATIKLPDLNTTKLASAMKTVEGTAKNMGISIMD